MAWSDEAPAPPAARVRLSREIPPMPAGNNFGTVHSGNAARRRRQQSRRAIWKNLLSLTVSTALIIVTGAAVLKAYERKAQAAPEPAASSPAENTPTGEFRSAEGGLASLRNP